MFVSSMSGMQSCELGHSHYQHPKRSSEHFDANLDNFSALTIFTTLKAIEAAPELVERLDALNECSLFRASDFKDPLSSRAFHALERLENEELSKLSQLVRQYLEKDPGVVPTLTDLPSEPDESIFSLSTISTDLLSADFLNTNLNEGESLAQWSEQAKPASASDVETEPAQSQTNRQKQGHTPAPPTVLPRSAKLRGITIVIFMTVWLGILVSIFVGSFLPPDYTKLPSRFEEVFYTPLQSAIVTDYAKSKREQYEFTVESREPLGIRHLQAYKKESVKGSGALHWARTALFMERLGGNISIALNENGTKAHVEVAKPQIFATSRDGENISNLIRLPWPNQLVAMDEVSSRQWIQNEEDRETKLYDFCFSRCKSINPADLSPAEFAKRIHEYLDQVGSLTGEHPKNYSGPEYLLELVIQDRSLSNEQIKVLEQISRELAAAYAEKRQRLKIIVPVKYGF
ncbi:MAG: hypothetical protein K2W95_13785 [Candidatus Obscuribacterales bacterium]|nr:hypothetical protein [Candidatus Obscuribacterales bacterium]